MVRSSPIILIKLMGSLFHTASLRSLVLKPSKNILDVFCTAEKGCRTEKLRNVYKHGGAFILSVDHVPKHEFPKKCDVGGR